MLYLQDENTLTNNSTRNLLKQCLNVKYPIGDTGPSNPHWSSAFLVLSGQQPAAEYRLQRAGVVDDKHRQESLSRRSVRTRSAAPVTLRGTLMRKKSLQVRRQKMQRQLERINRQIAVEQKRLSVIEARLAVLSQERRQAA